MCTAATYKTKDFYFGRTLDYEFSYGDEITITPRNYPFHFRHSDKAPDSHYAIIGMAHVAGDYPLYYDAINEKGLGEKLSENNSYEWSGIKDLPEECHRKVHCCCLEPCGNDLTCRCMFDQHSCRKAHTWTHKCNGYC